MNKNVMGQTKAQLEIAIGRAREELTTARQLISKMEQAGEDVRLQRDKLVQQEARIERWQLVLDGWEQES